MPKQFGQQENDSLASNANQNFVDTCAVIAPPPFQLKAEINPDNEKVEESSSFEGPYQLTAATPPSNGGNNNNKNQAGVDSQNNTGLPDGLKSGVENLSGLSLDDVKVHYNSDKPAQLQAHAYAQGTDIHVASGQERHLPHEAWHVVQQKQGRVQPTTQMKGVKVNDDHNLEKEADVNGQTAMKTVASDSGADLQLKSAGNSATQLKEVSEEEMESALDVADDMIEDSGGAEAIDTIFGAGFSDRYYDIIVDMESGALSFDGFIDQLPEEDQFGIYDELDEATTQYLLLFDLVYDETAKSEDEVNYENVDIAHLLIEELEIRMELLSVLNKYYELLVAQGLIDMLPNLVAFCKLLVGLKYFAQFKELENKLNSLQKAVGNADSNLKKAALETGIDLGIGAIAVGLTAAGMMTPGLNIAIFIGGVAVGYALSTEDTGTKIIQGSTKGGGFILSKAMEGSEKLGANAAKIKSIGPGLDLILNSKEAYDKYQELAILQAVLKEYITYYDEECKRLTVDFSSDMKKLKGMVEHAEKVFDDNWDTLNQYENQIANLQNELSALAQ